MGNLTLRERAMFALVALIGVAFLVFLFGIRPLNNNYETMKVTKAELEAQKAHYDQLKISNAETQQAITVLDANISTIEKSFIADLKTENAVQYLMSEFEKNNIPFLVTFETADIGMDVVTLADGSTSNDRLICKRITMKYSSTDGYEVTQYNQTLNPTMHQSKSVIEKVIRNTGKIQPEGAYGYDEFIKALEEIAKKNPDCIKLNEIEVIGSNGYFELTAAVDFYGAELTTRVSTDTNIDSYAKWGGDTNVDTEGGFIGMPYLVTNPKSQWYGIMIDENKVAGFTERPFASYLSNAQFTKLISEKGLAAIVTANQKASDTTETTDTTEPAA